MRSAKALAGMDKILAGMDKSPEGMDKSPEGMAKGTRPVKVSVTGGTVKVRATRRVKTHAPRAMNNAPISATTETSATARPKNAFRTGRATYLPRKIAQTRTVQKPIRISKKKSITRAFPTR